APHSPRRSSARWLPANRSSSRLRSSHLPPQLCSRRRTGARKQLSHDDRNELVRDVLAGFRLVVAYAGIVRAEVLVVEDDRAVRRMLERTLAAEGYEVMGVSDGGAALASIERAAPDLVVLDVGLPDLDGFAVCRRLRDKGLALPVLMLTARDAVGDRVAGLDAG